MNLSIDKDALADFCSVYKDYIFLVVLLLVLVVGGWFLYQQSAQSVEDIIQEKISAGAGGVNPDQDDEVVSSEEVVNTLLSKRSSASYEVQRSPFGSQEEQYRKRQEVESAYQKGRELFEAGDYQSAIQQFDRVIALDVTESRISYPVLPSEYKRRAQQEYAKRNLDTILQDARKNIQEGDRLVEAGSKKEAIEAYNKASTSLSNVIDSDPQGQNIGIENLNTVKELQQEAYNKAMNIQREIIREELNQELAESQQVITGQDMIAALKKYFALNQIQQRLDTIDPNSTLISRNERSTLQSRIEQIQNKIAGNFDALIAQAESQFNQALAQEDLVKTQEAIFILRQALNYRPSDKELANKINDFVNQRTNLLIQKATQFYQEQQTILANNEYDKFDENKKKQFINELYVLRERGNLTSEQRKQVSELETNLRSLVKPGPLTDAYEIVSVTPGATSRYRIVVRDKTSTSNRALTLYLREGEEDKKTQINLKQVDTDNGFVILSKSGYMDVKINISSSQ